jgi:hypothetical protein
MVFFWFKTLFYPILQSDEVNINTIHFTKFAINYLVKLRYLGFSASLEYFKTKTYIYMQVSFEITIA